jgi:hypothetical protein
MGLTPSRRRRLGWRETGRTAVADDRLPTEMWVMAHLRQLSAAGVAATVARKGEPTYGTLILKLNLLDGTCRVLSQARDIEGRLGWLAALGGAPVSEGDADAYIARAVTRDPDLWVVEIEDREGRHPFEGKML